MNATREDGGGNAGLEVDAGAALFVHDAHFQGVAFELQQVFDATEQVLGEGHFGGAVHFRFDDVDAAGAGVAATLQVMQGNQAGDDAVENALREFPGRPGQERPGWSSGGRRCE